MPLTSVNEIKNILYITGSDHDSQISVLLPIVESHISNYCFTTFDTGSSFPDGLKLVCAHMIENIVYRAKKANITSETIGAYSVTYGREYPSEIIELLKPYRRVKFT